MEDDDGESAGPSLRLGIVGAGGSVNSDGYGTIPEPRSPKWRPYESFQTRTPRQISQQFAVPPSPGLFSRLRGRVGKGYSNPPSASTHFANESTKWRLLDRKAAFHQSRGVWNVSRVNKSKELYFADLFHTIIDLPTYKSVLLFFALYLFWIFVFAWLYFAVSDSCELEINTFRSAWYFSVETIMTIGYGLPTAQRDSPFFNDCDGGWIFITLQSLIGVILDGVAVGIVFTRMTRAQTRATTIVFSDYAVVRKVRGRLTLQLQVCEMRKHQLVEAHVRCYAISRHFYRQGSPAQGRSSGPAARRPVYLKTQYMRLSKPDDELGGVLLMGMPSVVVHDIDAWSPLLPSDWTTALQRKDPSADYRYPEPLQRSVDTINGNREDLTASKVPGEKAKSFTLSSDEEDAIRRYWREHKVEIVVVVEGIDPPTSCTMQARHSYTVDDIAWHHEFEPCVYETDDGSAEINFSLFHNIVKVHPEKKVIENVFSDP